MDAETIRTVCNSAAPTIAALGAIYASLRNGRKADENAKKLDENTKMTEAAAVNSQIAADELSPNSQKSVKDVINATAKGLVVMSDRVECLDWKFRHYVLHEHDNSVTRSNLIKVLEAEKAKETTEERERYKNIEAFVDEEFRLKNEMKNRKDEFLK